MNIQNIDYPSKEELEEQVNKIIEIGMPDEKTSWNPVLSLYKELGHRVIFQGMANVVFVSIMIFLLIMTASYPVFYSRKLSLYGLVFIFSPLLYQILCLLSIWKEKQTNTYDIKMACRYTVHHLSALRMLVFSCMSIAANLSIVFLLYHRFNITFFLQLILASISSLFLYAAISIALILKSRRVNYSYFLLPVWVMFHMLLLYKGGSVYEALIGYVPVAVHFVVGIAMILIYLRYLSLMINKKMQFVH